MTQLTKLGDVAKYLREGDAFLWCGMGPYIVRPAPGDGIYVQFGSDPLQRWSNQHPVKLANPRWVPVSLGQAVGAGDVLLIDGEVCEQSAAMLAPAVYVGNAFALIRTVNGKPEPVRAEGEALPRVVQTSELLCGDRFRLLESTIEYITLKSHTENDWAECVANPVASCIGIRASRSLGSGFRVALLSRNNPIPGESPEPAAPPYREATRADVRVGMRFVPTDHVDDTWRVPVTCLVVAEGKATVRRDDGKTIQLAVTILGNNRRPIQVLGDDSDPPVQPAPNRSSLRAAWEFLADRTPWPTIARTLLTRAGVVDGDEAAKQGAYFRDEATKLVDQMLTERKRHARSVGWSLLVVLTDDADRPVELYSEALNGAAYRAKVEELWPTPVIAVEPRKSCVNCGAMCGGSVNKCGDCLMAMDKLASERTGIRAAMHSSEKRFRGLAEPDRNLTPTQRLHWEHTRGWQTPSWEG